MGMQTYSLQPGRLEKFAGQILKHAMVTECLTRGGRQVQMPKNSSKTYVGRRFVPYGGTTSQPNRFFQDGNGDRGAAMVQAHATQDGVTAAPDSIVAQDVTVVMQQYSCLYGFTDQTYDLHEDDIPKAMVEQTGQRVTLVNEMVNFGALKASTNQFFGGTGTSIATVDGGLTLGFLRKIAKSLQMNHGAPVTKVLDASGLYNTEAVAEGYIVYITVEAEPDVRDLTGFIPAEKYASGKPMPNEIGKVERFRFVTTPEFPALQNAGAAVGATGLASTSGTNIDVHQFIVTAADAWSQVSVRGKNAIDSTFIPPNQKSKSDPHGQRGYAGAIWYKAAMVENNGWLAVGNVGLKTLV